MRQLPPRYLKLMIVLMILLCGPLLGSASLAQEGDTVAEPLVIVNDDTIRTSDVDRELMAVHRQIAPAKRAGYDYRKLIDKVVNDRLILQEAFAIGMDEDERIVDEVKAVQLREGRRIVARDLFSYDSLITDAQILEYFRSNYFKIKLRTLATRECDEAARYAEMIEHGAPMDSIAREVSLDTRRYMGGAQSLRYWFTVDDETKPLVKDLKVGQLTKPTPFREACMIIRVDDRVEADTSELASVKTGIVNDLRKQRRESAWQSLIDSLSESYAIEIDSAVMHDIEQDSLLIFRGEFLKQGSDRELISATGIDGLTENELRRTLSHKAMSAGDMSFVQLLEAAVADEVQTMVLNAAATKEGVISDPKVVEMMQRTADSMMIEHYLQENVVSKIKFNHEEFQKYYDENPDLFREESEIRLYDLQVADKETAEKVIAMLKEGADFNYVKGKFGLAEGVAHDEDAWMRASVYPEQIAEQLDTLKAGEYTSPLAVTNGFVIFKLRDRKPGAVRPIEDVDMQIRQAMFQREFSRILDDVLSVLREASTIEYFDENIDNYFGSDENS